MTDSSFRPTSFTSFRLMSFTHVQQRAQSGGYGELFTGPDRNEQRVIRVVQPLAASFF